MREKSGTLCGKIRLVIVLLFAVGITAVSASAQTDDPASIPPPDSVTVAGTIQPVIGCAGEWDTACAESQLTYDEENDIWLATFDVLAGGYEYKAALNGSWDDNYGLNAEYYGANIPLEVAEDGPVTFWYDHKTRWVSDSINSLFATLAGSFQDEIGCASEWAPDCLRAMLQDPNGDGLYTFITIDIPAGEHEAKVALNRSWEVNYGLDGELDGPNIPFNVGEGQAVIFAFDPATSLLTIEASDDIPADIVSQDSGGGLPPAAAPFPDTVVIPGTIQSVLGCAGDWEPDCANTALTFSEENQLWRDTFDLPAGEYEYKAALNGSWDVNFGLNAELGGANIPLVLGEDTAVTFYFDNQTGWVADSVNNLIANVPGSFQDELGCAEDWMPACLRSWLQDPDGDGVFTFQTLGIPVGEYEAKVAVNGTWDVNYGEGGALDGANIPFSVPEADTLVTFTFDSRSNLLNISVGSGGVQGNISQRSAHWVAADTIAWDIEPAPGNQYFFHYDPLGGVFSLGFDGISGGEAVPLTVDPDGLSDDIAAKFPHLRSFTALKFSEDDLSVARVALKGQVAISAQNESGEIIDAAGLQIPGVLDDLYPYDGDLGVTFGDDGVPTLTLWAPTARQVRLHLFDDANPNTEAETFTMRPTPSNGTWSITGESDWTGKYYLYEVQLFVPTEGSVQTNLATDPYSFSLATNSSRSQIVDLTDPATMPEGWQDVIKPGIAAPEDIVIYELHMRDFSVNDPSVPAELRGTYSAFTVLDSNGMQHLAALSEAGLTHLHLLPTFDIATIDEDKSTWTTPSFDELASLPPDSEEQQALISAIRDQDPFNWGYDPFHYTVPEGSYAVNPEGISRIVEYRDMVQALNEIGLRVVVDVVYNHTSDSGQSDKSVLDRIVPGYYHRLNSTGRVETSTCCQNTATEHDMMRKLMVDSVVTWATAYKIDAFRFDLMGHHMKEDMLAVRAALDALTLEAHGVDGQNIYIYGEGWDFGEVGGNARGTNATQFNLAGTGIGTFSDRLRDAARGGSPFGGQTEQGFLNGLYVYPNATDQGSDTEQLTQLQSFMDIIRLGLAGNLSDFSFVGSDGTTVTGSDILYNGSPAGYTADPQEQIVYISKHDNETLFDIIQYKAPVETDTAVRARMQTLGNSIVMFSQGVPFFQAGDDLLRSKSLDRNSYNSGDWFNRLDFTYQSNNWGVGLPPAGDNQSMWPTMQPLLANPDLAPTPEDIAFARDTFRELLQIRAGSPLFRLQTAAQIQDRLQFLNVGDMQIPGLIVMSLSDLTGEDVDPNYDMIVVVFNATPDEMSFTETAVTDLPFSPHPVQQNSVDGVVQTAAFEAANGTFTVPAWTTAVFVLPQGSVAPPVRTEDTEVITDAGEEADAMIEGAEAETTSSEPVADEPVTEEAAHNEAEQIDNAPGTPWVIWLSAIGGGFLLALIVAWFSRRKKADQVNH